MALEGTMGEMNDFGSCFLICQQAYMCNVNEANMVPGVTSSSW